MSEKLYGICENKCKKEVLPKDEALQKTIVVTETETDLNDYTEDGIYYFSSSVTPTNIPTGVVDGFLQVISNGTIHKQIWYRQGTNNANDYETYIRTYNGSDGWSNWQRFIAKTEADNVQTATITKTNNNATFDMNFKRSGNVVTVRVKMTVPANKTASAGFFDLTDIPDFAKTNEVVTINNNIVLDAVSNCSTSSTITGTSGNTVIGFHEWIKGSIVKQLLSDDSIVYTMAYAFNFISNESDSTHYMFFKYIV